MHAVKAAVASLTTIRAADRRDSDGRSAKERGERALAAPRRRPPPATRRRRRVPTVTAWAAGRRRAPCRAGEHASPWRQPPTPPAPRERLSGSDSDGGPWERIGRGSLCGRPERAQTPLSPNPHGSDFLLPPSLPCRLKQILKVVTIFGLFDLDRSIHFGENLDWVCGTSQWKKERKKGVGPRISLRVTPDRAVARQVFGFGQRSRMTSEGDTNER